MREGLEFGFPSGEGARYFIVCSFSLWVKHRACSSCPGEGALWDSCSWGIKMFWFFRVTCHQPKTVWNQSAPADQSTLPHSSACPPRSPTPSWCPGLQRLAEWVTLGSPGALLEMILGTEPLLGWPQRVLARWNSAVLGGREGGAPSDPSSPSAWELSLLISALRESPDKEIQASPKPFVCWFGQTSDFGALPEFSGVTKLGLGLHGAGDTEHRVALQSCEWGHKTDLNPTHLFYISPSCSAPPSCFKPHVFITIFLC